MRVSMSEIGSVIFMSIPIDYKLDAAQDRTPAFPGATNSIWSLPESARRAPVGGSRCGRRRTCECKRAAGHSVCSGCSRALCILVFGSPERFLMSLPYFLSLVICHLSLALVTNDE